jgi:hypothetical protein
MDRAIIEVDCRIFHKAICLRPVNVAFGTQIFRPVNNRLLAIVANLNVMFLKGLGLSKDNKSINEEIHSNMYYSFGAVHGLQLSEGRIAFQNTF